MLFLVGRDNQPSEKPNSDDSQRANPAPENTGSENSPAGTQNFVLVVFGLSIFVEPSSVSSLD